MVMRYTEALTIRFEIEVMEELRKIAEKERLSAGSVVRMAVKEMLEKCRQGSTNGITHRRVENSS